MILEGAIGDAYGAGFEFADREVIREHNDLTHYITHPKFEAIHARYTDDTQMALALAEMLIDGSAWTPLSIANKFVEAFQRDPREGYSKRLYYVLSEVTDGQAFLESIKPISTRNGAAMRAYPIGVLSDVAEVLDYSAIQASITHDTPQGIQSAQAVALMAHFTYHQLGSLTDLPAFLLQSQNVTWNTNWKGEVEINGIQTVEAVLTILSSAPTSMRDILIRSVDFGGDVDTVASLALAIASNSTAVQNDLPVWLTDEIENGAYGRDYIQNIDQKLKKVS